MRDTFVQIFKDKPESSFNSDNSESNQGQKTFISINLRLHLFRVGHTFMCDCGLNESFLYVVKSTLINYFTRQKSS